MKIACIGAGRIGGTLARFWAKSGHELLISSRHLETLDPLLKELGKNACKGTFEEAAQFGDIILLAIPLGGISRIESKIGKYIQNKVVLDAMNPFAERDGDIARDIFTRKIASGQATQERFPNAKIVRAFSSIRFTELLSESHRKPPLIAVPYSTDYNDTKKIAEQLISDAGFEPFDLGPLTMSKPLDPNGFLFGKALTKKQIQELL